MALSSGDVVASGIVLQIDLQESWFVNSHAPANCLVRGVWLLQSYQQVCTMSVMVACQFNHDCR